MNHMNEREHPLKRSVLVVEDDNAVRRSLQLLLRSRGYEVRAYPTAKLAMGDPQSLATDCLIADLVMPGGDGIALLHHLRSHDWAGPAMLISGYLTPEAETRAHDAGFTAIFKKPLPETVIVSALERMMDGKAPSQS
ncbi:MAG: response regulator [Sphingomonadales bacterium]